jgi:hypothetical protein
MGAVRLPPLMPFILELHHDIRQARRAAAYQAARVREKI